MSSKITEFTASFSFYKYFYAEHGRKRDISLEALSIYILPSNIVLSLSSIVVFFLIGTGGLGFLFTFIFIIQYLFQISICTLAASRNRSDKDKEAFNNNKSIYKDSLNDKIEAVNFILIKYRLPSTADVALVKKCFRDLAKEYHPDSPTGDADKFMEIRQDLYYVIEYLKLKAHKD